QIQRTVKRCRLAAAGWAGYQRQSVRLLKNPLKRRQRFGTEAKILHPHLEVLLVENSDDQLFAKQRWHRADAQIDVAAFGDEADAAFLWQASLGDVHLPDNFDARDDGRMDACRRLDQVAEHAVDAIANARAALVGFDVNVAGF